MVDNFLPRINTRITKEALARLNQECQLRKRTDARPWPQGSVITELIMKHLPAVPDDPTLESSPPRKKRGRPSKSDKASA